MCSVANLVVSGGGLISGGLGIASSVIREALLGRGPGACPLEKLSKIDLKICIFVPFLE